MHLAVTKNKIININNNKLHFNVCSYKILNNTRATLYSAPSPPNCVETLHRHCVFSIRIYTTFEPDIQ